MFDNLIFIVAVVAVLWVISFAVYMYASRRQQGLQKDIDSLQAKLNQDNGYK